MNRDHSVVFEIALKYCISDSFVDYEGYSFSSKGFLSTVVDKLVIWIKFPHPVHFSSLIPKMLMFTLALYYLTTSNLPWFMDLTFQVPMQYLFFTASDFTSITSHIHNWSLFSLWLCLFILSGVIFPLFSSSILGTYCPGEFIYQCPIFAFSYCSWDSQGQNTEVVCHSLLQWTTFCQTSPPWPAPLGLPRRHGLVSLS